MGTKQTRSPKVNFNLRKDVPFIHNSGELSKWLRKSYVIEDYLVDYDTYNDFYERHMNLIRASYVIKECREFPIKFKFKHSDRNYLTLEFRHFMINMILWLPFVELYGMDVLDKTFIIDCYNDIPSIENYINNKLITTLRKCNVGSTTINYSISQVLFNLRMISVDFSLICGLNFSAVDFFEMYNDNKEIRDIMEVTFDKTMQPHEIETKLAELQAREIEIYKSIPNNPIGIILRTKTGIKEKQFAEYTIAEALKPSLDGVTIPIPIENSTMLRGLDRPSYLYIDGTGARKSLVMNKKVMGRAGHFGKIVLLLAGTLSMSTDISDCGTKHTVAYDVKSKKHLKKLNGKFFKMDKDENDYQLLDAETDKHLIGKTIHVRSAATCALGDCVCAKCVGLTASTNFDIASGVAAFDSEEITKVVNQSILSTKHLLTTNSEEIIFNKDFYDFFILLGGEINPNVNDNDKVENIDDYAIYIDPDDIIKMEEQDYDSLYNTCIYNGRMYIRNVNNPDAEDILIQVEGNKEIFLTEQALELMKSGKGLIYFKDLDDDVKLFEMVILNKELTKPLYLLMDLLNKQRKDENDETIDSMSNKFLDLLIESGIDANCIAAEFITNRLIRSCINKYERPNFYNEELEPYEIYTVARALTRNKSPLIGLSYQDIKRQLTSQEMFTERFGTSYLDPFYWHDVPTDNLKEYYRIATEEEKKLRKSNKIQ